MRVPSITTRRAAVEAGVKYSMKDEEVLGLLKGAKVPKAQREVFLPWFRRMESKHK